MITCLCFFLYFSMIDIFQGKCEVERADSFSLKPLGQHCKWPYCLQWGSAIYSIAYLKVYKNLDLGERSLINLHVYIFVSSRWSPWSLMNLYMPLKVLNIISIDTTTRQINNIVYSPVKKMLSDLKTPLKTAMPNWQCITCNNLHSPSPSHHISSLVLNWRLPK